MIAAVAVVFAGVVLFAGSMIVGVVRVPEVVDDGLLTVAGMIVMTGEAAIDDE